MFFSQELLSRRDSGFGLLWLAATLGSKSTFKKLPKKSILTANISQLCDLISEPSEPLALRLSSNLLVGVARVYKVKQDIFLSDVTACFASLNKVVQAMKSSLSVDRQLQMAQPSARPSAVTLSADPRAALVMDFDALVADWDAFLNITGENEMSKVNSLETARAGKHTLKEHHEDILSASFDMSRQGTEGRAGPSSSQCSIDLVFGDGDDIFALPPDNFDADGLADELAEELGWIDIGTKDKLLQVSPVLDKSEGVNLVPLVDFTIGGDNLHSFDEQNYYHNSEVIDVDKNLGHETVAQGSQANELSPTSFSRLLLSQDEVLEPRLQETEVATKNLNDPVTQIARKKLKRTRIVFDPRIELTNDELKTSRTQYLQIQHMLRHRMTLKAFQDSRSQAIATMISGVPDFICAPVLVDFWKEIFKAQTEDRFTAFHVHTEEPPRKRRKSSSSHERNLNNKEDLVELLPMDRESNLAMDVDPGLGFDVPFTDLVHQDFGVMRSSEEPGQGRHVSKQSPAFGDVSLDVGTQNGSQKSSLFPWDNAGGSSSGAFDIPRSNSTPLRPVDVRLKGNVLHPRESSVGLSQLGSGPKFSPAPLNVRDSFSLGEDYCFEVDVQDSPTCDSQRSDTNLISLERNSFNFLEYVKMQSRSLPSSATPLTFDIIVPQSTSTRHVAASAFYHCLEISVLATKDFLRLAQEGPYQSFFVSIV